MPFKSIHIWINSCLLTISLALSFCRNYNKFPASSDFFFPYKPELCNYGLFYVFPSVYLALQHFVFELKNNDDVGIDFWIAISFASFLKNYTNDIAFLYLIRLCFINYLEVIINHIFFVFSLNNHWKKIYFSKKMRRIVKSTVHESY